MKDKIISANEIYTVISDKPVYIDIEEVTSVDVVGFSKKYIEKVKYIPLKTNELIGGLERVLMSENRIFILDSVSERVLIFDSEGNFIGYAGSVGQGHGEYVRPESIFFYKDDKGNNLLGVCDVSLFINYYDFDGNFQVKKDRFPGTYCLAYGQDKFFNALISGIYSKELKDIYLMACIDAKGEVLSKGFSMFPLQRNSPSNWQSLRYNNQDLLFTPLLSDTTYIIKSEMELEAKYIFRHNKTSVWKEKYLKQDNQTLESLIRSNKLTRIYPPINVTDDFISFSVGSNEKAAEQTTIHQYFFDSAKNKTYRLINKEITLNKGDFFENPIANPLNVYRNNFIGFLPVEAFDFFRNIKKNYDIKFTKELNNLLEDEKVEQAIVLYDLK